MKDFIIRVLVGAVSAALVSGGILYFAFDQALRGVETAIGATNERISDNGELVRDVGKNITSFENNLEDKLDNLAANISKANGRTLSNVNRLAWQQYEFQSNLAATVGLVHMTLTAFPLDSFPIQEQARLVSSLSDLEAAEKKLDAMASELKDVMILINSAQSTATDALWLEAAPETNSEN